MAIYKNSEGRNSFYLYKDEYFDILYEPYWCHHEPTIYDDDYGLCVILSNNYELRLTPPIHYD